MGSPIKAINLLYLIAPLTIGGGSGCMRSAEEVEMPAHRHHQVELLDTHDLFLNKPSRFKVRLLTCFGHKHYAERGFEILTKCEGGRLTESGTGLDKTFMIIPADDTIRFDFYIRKIHKEDINESNDTLTWVDMEYIPVK
jgi:hypothetical protein